MGGIVSSRDEAVGTTHVASAEWRGSFGLASRVLVHIVIFVIIAEILIYLPAVATYRNAWLHTRLSAGYTAALVLQASPRGMVPEALSRQLLESVGARIIVLQTRGTKQILAAGALPTAVDEVCDLRQLDMLESVTATIRSLISPKGRVITLLGEAPMGGEAIEITMDEAPLKQALADYSRRLLNFTLALCVIVASLAVISIHLLVLRPVQRLTTSLVDFGGNPEDASRIIVPSGKWDEIGQAEEALAAMQKTLVRELNQKKHLAALGLAVAKINHDLRNMLTSAQLLSDRLANVTDPLAQRLAPKLVATLDRAIRFCQATLTYGRAVDDPPKLKPVLLREIVSEVAEAVLLGAQGTAAILAREREGAVAIINNVPEDFEIFADAEHMFRILMNLIRNGVEALEHAGAAPGQPPCVTIEARHEDGAAIIEIADTGPGVPEAIREKLFAAFFNTTRTGGSGLGLVIAADLVRAQGGSIELLPRRESSGATFKIILPPKSPGIRG